MSSHSRIFVASAGLLAGLSLLALANGGSVGAAAPVAIPGLPPQAKEWQSCPAEGPMDGIRIENFGVVSPGCLYRSAQPGKGDFEWLAEQGFRSVISLRKERDDDAERVKALGMNYLYLPVTDYRIPTDDQAHEFLVFVRDSKNWPALVHCAGGQGRAGIMAALARYSIDGWTMGEALREAKEYRPFNFRIFGEQRRFLNRWKDRFPAGAYHPSKPMPQWPPVQSAIGSRQKASR